MNDKGKKILLVIVLLIIALVGGTYAFWTWTSPENKNVVFNTSNGLKEFIVYDEGDSKFVGDFQVADSYTGGVHTTVSISKTASASNVDFYATIYMDINEIGTNLRSTPGLKWTVTKGDSTSTTVVSSGDFVGNSAGDTLTLYNDIEVTTATQKFTIWLWIDSSLNPSDELSGETIDSSVWTQVNQVVEDKFEITKLTIFRDKIYATAVNSTANIMYYAVTSSNTTPTSWTTISTTDQNRIYSLEYTTTSSGTNYVWFKDKNNKVISKAVTAQLNYNINYYDVGGGEFSGVHTTGYPTTYKFGTAVTFDTPTKTGYNFLGYFTNKNGSGTAVTGITSTQTGDVTLFAKWEATTYTISYNGNMFSTNGLTTNGLTFAYDYENSILTINGTATGDTYIISFTNNLTFVEGDKYNVNFSYVSGSLTTNNGAIILFSTEVVNDSKNSLSPRNHIDTQFPTSSTPNNGTLSISSLAATSGSKLRYWVWSSDTSGNITFNNYKVKVNITKVQTKTIAFNDNYGTLPVPKRKGFTFGGWYTGNNGTGTRITSDSIFTGNADQTLYAKWIDDIEPYGYADLRLNNGTYTLSLNNYGDGGSGMVTPYGFALIDSGRCEEATYTSQTGTSKTYNSGLSQGVAYYGCIKLSDRAGNKAYLRSATIPYANSSDASNAYTSSGEYAYVIPMAGIYKLEVWGAQGGSNSTVLGGYGGYSKGMATLAKGTTLYINVGGTTSTNVGGFNGGANGGSSSGYGGGGATHIATLSGRLTGLENNKTNILIVAGGGGGADNWSDGAQGGYGGGFQGVAGTWTASTSMTWALGGTQTAGGVCNTSGAAYNSEPGAFGIGGVASQWGGGGGGGYYGGAGGNSGSSWVSAGGGGSGYIGNALLNDKYMYCYNCTTSNDTNTKTYTTTNVSDTPTADYAKKGSGASKITFMSSASKELTYNNNGGTGCYYSSVIPGAAYGELCIPIKDGYSFTGWYTAASNGTKITSSTIVTNTNNHTIYAHWTADTKPSINFGTNGTDGVYIKGDANSKIVVNKGNVDLNTSSFKYIWSSNTTATPDTPFTNKAIVNFKNNNSTGTYYLIAKACDMNGTCTSLTSEPFYIDNTSPSGSVALSFDVNTNVLTASLTASDSGSGISNYGYLIQNSSSCPTSGYIASSNNGYNFNITSNGTYYVCVKLVDKVGNISYASKSTTISMGTSGSDIIDDRANIANLSNNLVGDMYRYQGTATAVTNNYICFGTTNKSTCTANTGTYMYRIIGIDTSGRMKLIKKEALDTSFRWSGSTNEWAYATTFTSLNDSTFLTNTTFVPSGWSDKIATITWKYGKQSSALNQPGTVIYDYEIGSNAKFTSTVDAKISLMYMHDYYLALNNTTSCGYGGSTYSQCKNGWISLSTNDSGAPVPSEWTMSGSASNNGGVVSAWMIYSTGYTTNYKVTDYLSIRPVFFLNSSVNIVDGTGTISNPYMIG